MRQSSLASFFVALGVATIPFYMLGLLDPLARRWMPVRIPISALMVVCPLVAALWCERSWSFVREALCVRPRGVWWGVASLIMPSVALGVWGWMRVGGELPVGPTPWASVVMTVPLFLISATCEQLGWQAYVAPRLLRRLGSWWRAALLLGVIWAAWHVIPYRQAERDWAWIGWQCASTVALRVVMSWLFVRTGSVIAVILCHASADVAFVAFPRFGSLYDPFRETVVTLVVVAVLGATSRRARPEHGAL